MAVPHNVSLYLEDCCYLPFIVVSSVLYLPVRQSAVLPEKPVITVCLPMNGPSTKKQPSIDRHSVLSLPVRQSTVLPDEPVDVLPALVPELPVPVHPVLVVVHQEPEPVVEVRVGVPEQQQAQGGDAGVQGVDGVAVRN